MIRRYLLIFALMIVATLIFSACTLFPDTNDGNQTPGTDDGSQTPPECVHSFSSWEMTQPATCKDEGVMSRTCTKCGEEESTKIAMTTTHTEVVVH